MRRKIAVMYCQDSDLTTKGYGKFITRLEDMLADEDVIVEGFSMEHIGFRITPGKVEVLYKGNVVPLGDFAMVYFKNRAAQMEIVLVLSAVLKQAYPHVVTIDPSNPLAVPSKLTEMAYLAQAGVHIPATLFLPQSDAKGWATLAAAHISPPCIVKATKASKGEHNYLANDWAEVRRIVGEHSTKEFIVQQYIPAEGDYRFVVLGGKIALVVHRQGADDSHLNNTSQGASSTPIYDWQTQFSKQCLADIQKAVGLLQRDTAGVDVIIDRENGQHYVLEVNSSPQLVSGAAIEEKAVALKRYLKSLIDQ